MAKYTIYHIFKRIKDLCTSEDRPRKGRPLTARLKKVIKAVQERVMRTPKKYARQIVKDMNASVTSIRRISKMISSWFPTRWEGDNIGNLSKNKNYLIRFFLEFGTVAWKSEKSVFRMKNNLQLNFLLTARMTNCLKNLQRKIFID